MTYRLKKAIVLMAVLTLGLMWVACSGGDSSTPTIQIQQTAATTSVVSSPTTVTTPQPTTAVPTTPQATPTPTLNAGQKDQVMADLDAAAAFLAPLAQPGGISKLLDRSKAKGTGSWDPLQREIDGRLRLEELLGKDPTLNQYRGQPGSDAPPSEGYLKAIKAAIEAGNFKTVGNGPKGVDWYLSRAIGTLLSFNRNEFFYENLKPTSETKAQYGPNPAYGSDGIINLPGWKDGYFALIRVYYALEALTSGRVQAVAR